MIGTLAVVGGGGTLAVKAVAPQRDFEGEPCAVVLEHVVPPDTVLALLHRAATLGAGGRADELRATDWSYRDARGRNAAHWSVRVGNRAATRGLVLGRAAVDLPDHDGVTPLMVAAGGVDAWHVDYLLGNGANPNATNALGQTPLMYLAASCTPVLAPADTALSRTPESALLRLVAAGANLDAQDHRGVTALMHATRGSGLRVRDLLAAGANPHLWDRHGRRFWDYVSSVYSADVGYMLHMVWLTNDVPDWSEQTPENRERHLAEVDTGFFRERPENRENRRRDDPWRPDRMPDTVFILPYRP